MKYTDNDKVFFRGIDGKLFVNEERALGLLLLDGILFCNERETLFQGKKDTSGPTTVLYVNCNDIFAWGCADAEPLPNKEIGNLFKMHRADPIWGTSKWCMLQRKQRPQKPVEELMKKDDSWTQDIEALPERKMERG